MNKTHVVYRDGQHRWGSCFEPKALCFCNVHIWYFTHTVTQTQPMFIRSYKIRFVVLEVQRSAYIRLALYIYNIFVDRFILVSPKLTLFSIYYCFAFTYTSWCWEFQKSRNCFPGLYLSESVGQIPVSKALYFNIFQHYRVPVRAMFEASLKYKHSTGVLWGCPLQFCFEIDTKMIWGPA